MASKSAQEQQVSTETVEEMLDTVDKTLDRLKTLYEQYFLGIQKQAPTHLHTTVERQLRDLSQLQIRNTGMRYRLATLQQKFGAYNSYWKRTLRQIENGTYLRNLSKVGREAIRSGAAIPEEILAAMPKRMREQVVRDREQAMAIAKRRAGDQQGDELLTLAPEEPPPVEEVAAIINEPSELRRELKTRSGAFVLDESDADMDLSAFFASVEQETAPTRVADPAPPPIAPPTRPTPLPSAMRAAATLGPAPPARKSSPIIARPAPSQATKSIPVVPGAAAAKGDVPVESMPGPFPRPPAPGPAVPAPKRPTPDAAVPTIAMPKIPSAPLRAAPAVAKPAALKPPPGMTEADVNTLYAKYVQAKQMVGEPAGPGAREKLLKTIHAQAPKIMEQYNAKAVDFSIVVKDNQVIIRAKPKL